MSSQIEITFEWTINGTYVDPTSIKLSDSTGSYGVKRTDTDAVVVADGTDMDKVDTGKYRYRFTPDVRGLTYFFYIEVVYGGITRRFAGVKYDPLPSGLTVADFLSGVKAAFRKPSLSTDDISESLSLTLQHMSDEGVNFPWVDTGVCTADQEYIDAPADYAGMITLSLYDMAGSEQEPLKAVRGGFREYRRARSEDSSAGLPEWYTYHYDKFYLYRMPGSAYPYMLHYNRSHPSYDGQIYYPVRFKPLIALGVKYYYAMEIRNEKYIKQWGPAFYERVKTVTDSILLEPSIVGD